MAWHSLYLTTEDQPGVVGALSTILEQHGYQRYDPFPGGAGTPPGLKTLVRHFVAPAHAGWVRVLGEPDLDTVALLSEQYLLIHGWLTEIDSGFEVYSSGERQPDGLLNFLRPGQPAESLVKAQQGLRSAAVGPDLLHKDIQQMAESYKLKPQEVNKMMNRLTGQLFGKLDRQSGGEASAMQDQARAMLARGAIWESFPGRRLLAISEILTLPQNWREPEFESVREAYQVARRLRKSPKALLMPDEKVSLDAIPTALDYQPIYVGK